MRLLKKYKDQQFRKDYQVNELDVRAFKVVERTLLNLPSLSSDAFSLLKYRLFTNNKYQTGVASRTKIVNRCIITNRGRGVIRKFGVCRHQLRELLQTGVIPGWKKARW